MLLEEVSWDHPGLETPLAAQLTPQEAINARRPKPSECDVVLVILWARIGTPLPPECVKADGTRYESGTEWEYCDAMAAAEKFGTPQLLVYRRTEEIRLNPDDADFDARVEQRRRVQRFFATFRNSDGSLRRSCHDYSTPTAFEALLEHHLREILWSRLQTTNGRGAATRSPATQQNAGVDTSLWPGSPYPGLRAFIGSEATIFFGRGRETDELVARFARDDRRFLAVIGASGSGKSSLVAAGLLPRLEAGAVNGRAFKGVQFTPGQVGGDPFLALATELVHAFPHTGWRPMELRDRLAMADACQLPLVVEEGLSRVPPSTEILLFVDQFEEIFTLTAESLREGFLELITRSVTLPRVRVVITLRADFYSHCTQWESLLQLLQADGSYPIGLPGPTALAEMIRRPAEAAGLTFAPNPGLVDRILSDTGTGPGALALMEFLLSKLYDVRDGTVLTERVYETLGGVGGVIEARAEAAIREPNGSIDEARLSTVFRALVTIDPDLGGPVRKRTALERLSDVQPLLDRLVRARLVVTGQGKALGGMVELAHEAVLFHWQRLVRWIEEHRGLLLWQRRLQVDVADWKRTNEDAGVLLRGARLTEAERWIAARPTELSADETAYVRASMETRDREQFALVRAERVAVARWALSGLGLILASVLATYIGLQPSTRAFVYVHFRPSTAQVVHYAMVVVVLVSLVLGVYAVLPALVRAGRLLAGMPSIRATEAGWAWTKRAAVALIVAAVFGWKALPVAPDVERMLEGETRKWSEVIAKAQLPSGGFSEHPKQSIPQVWTTAQALVALTSLDDPQIRSAVALPHAFDFIELAKIENFTLKDDAEQVVEKIADPQLKKVFGSLPFHPVNLAMVLKNLPLPPDETTVAAAARILREHKSSLYRTGDAAGGWGYFEQFPWAATEVAAWVAVAQARSLRLRNAAAWPAEARDNVVHSLADTIHFIGSRRLLATGGYSPIPDVGNETFGQTYVTAMAIWAIAESLAVTPPIWTDAEKRELEGQLKSAVGWLDRHAEGDGWRIRPSNPSNEPTCLGATLQTLCILGELPSRFLNERTRILQLKRTVVTGGGNLLTKRVDDNQRMADNDRYYGQTAYTSEGSTFLWYPWSLCAFGALARDDSLTEHERHDAAEWRDMLLARAHEFGIFAKDQFLYVPAEGVIGVAMSQQQPPTWHSVLQHLGPAQ